MSLQNNWGLQIDPGVLKDLRRIPQQDVLKIVGVIKILPLDPYFGDIQKMKGVVGTWRRRIGSYRIFYAIKTEIRVIFVFRIERRTSKTY